MYAFLSHSPFDSNWDSVFFIFSFPYIAQYLLKPCHKLIISCTYNSNCSFGLIFILISMQKFMTRMNNSPTMQMNNCLNYFDKDILNQLTNFDKNLKTLHDRTRLRNLLTYSEHLDALNKFIKNRLEQLLSFTVKRAKSGSFSMK